MLTLSVGIPIIMIAILVFLVRDPARDGTSEAKGVVLLRDRNSTFRSSCPRHARGRGQDRGGNEAGDQVFAPPNTLLNNLYYIGKVSFRGVEYEGRHQPLVDEEVFCGPGHPGRPPLERLGGIPSVSSTWCWPRWLLPPGSVYRSTGGCCAGPRPSPDRPPPKCDR